MLLADDDDDDDDTPDHAAPWTTANAMRCDAMRTIPAEEKKENEKERKKSQTYLSLARR